MATPFPAVVAPSCVTTSFLAAAAQSNVETPSPAVAGAALLAAVKRSFERPMVVGQTQQLHVNGFWLAPLLRFFPPFSTQQRIMSSTQANRRVLGDNMPHSLAATPITVRQTRLFFDTTNDQHYMRLYDRSRVFEQHGFSSYKL